MKIYLAKNWPFDSMTHQRAHAFCEFKQYCLVRRHNSGQAAPGHRAHEKFGVQAPTVRATNAGGTAIIDAQGRFSSNSNLLPEGNCRALSIRPTKTSLFLPNGPDAGVSNPMWLLCGGLMLFAVLARQKPFRKKRVCKMKKC
jgi:hypothetical protein